MGRIRKQKKTVGFTKEEIEAIDCGKTALALCGFLPFGDCNSIRHRLNAARSQAIKLEQQIKETEPYLPRDEILALFKHELKVWKYAIAQGEMLLERELANPKSR